MPRVNPDATYGLWVIMTCQCRFVGFNACTTLVWETDNGGGYVCGQEAYRKFCCGPKTALKEVNFKTKIQRSHCHGFPRPRDPSPLRVPESWLRGFVQNRQF